MMYQLITMQEVTNQDYPIQYLSNPSTSIEEMDIRDFLINILSNLIRQNVKRPSYLSLISILETDLSSIWPRFEIKSETTLFEDTFVEKFMEEMLEFNIVVRMPPLSEWSVRAKVKSVEKAKPHIVEPEGF